MMKESVSFGFSKIAKKEKLNPTVATVVDADEDQKDNEFASVSAIEGSKIVGDGIKTGTKQELVIPLIARNRWKVPTGSKRKNEESVEEQIAQTDGEADEAKLALLKDAANFNEEWEKNGKNNGDAAIPLMLQNQVPMGFETDDSLDVSLRPDEAAEADYEAIPIEEYGKAMLRGMGWSEGAAIGLTNKQAVKVKMPELRPKGLGLGADRKLVEKIKAATSEKQKENKDELAMVVGAPVKLLSGVTKGQYAKIQSFDEDNARVMVKLSVGGKVITISQYSIELVSTKEFDSESKYINNDKYEKFKEKTDAELRRQVEEEERKEVERDKTLKKSSKIDRLQKPAKVESSSKSNGQSTSSNKVWLENDLRVRIISKTYKNGKYYKSKVIIEDVESIESCSCKTEEGDFLDNLSQDMLETTIPKNKMAIVKIVGGKYKGEIGRLVELNGRQQVASVQLIAKSNRVKDFSYDDICEYVCDESYLEEL